MTKLRISSFELSESTNDEGIQIGEKLGGRVNDLNNIVILTGANGSGKSRFLKLFQQSFDGIRNDVNYNGLLFKVTENDETNGGDIEKELTIDIAKTFNIVNYSHFDAKLQSSEKFSPYVIHQAKNKLKKCNYEETALNSLLYLRDLAEGYSMEYNQDNKYEELIDFIEFAKELELEFCWNQDTKELKIFDRKLEDARLSPGQLYALRIAVACKVHEVGKNFVFLLDEPETHLHPSMLIKVINKLLNHFKEAQFFIATHSLPLISYLTVMYKDTTVLYMEKGVLKDRLRSNTGPILNNLVGTEDEQFAIKQLFVSSEELACNKFCMECFLDATMVKGGICGDSSVSMAENSFSLSDSDQPIIIVDYGAGYGRLLECMIEDNIKIGYKYNAYNVDKDAAEYCAKLIADAQIQGKSYLDKNNLSELDGKVDRVFMVNVLHEISPELWKKEFQTIHNLLKEDGKLVIIEREILTIGESPFVNGYLMLTGREEKSIAAQRLFGEGNGKFERHKQKSHIIAHTIDKYGVNAAKDADLEKVFFELERDALIEIDKLRKIKENIYLQKDRYKHGLSLAFWLNQLSCAIMCRENLKQN